MKRDVMWFWTQAIGRLAAPDDSSGNSLNTVVLLSKAKTHEQFFGLQPASPQLHSGTIFASTQGCVVFRWFPLQLLIIMTWAAPRMNHSAELSQGMMGKSFFNLWVWGIRDVAIKIHNAVMKRCCQRVGGRCRNRCSRQMESVPLQWKQMMLWR